MLYERDFTNGENTPKNIELCNMLRKNKKVLKLSRMGAPTFVEQNVEQNLRKLFGAFEFARSHVDLPKGFLRRGDISRISAKKIMVKIGNEASQVSPFHRVTLRVRALPALPF